MGWIIGRKKELAKRKMVSFGEYLILASIGEIETSAGELIQQLQKPMELCGKQVPNSLDDMSFGNLVSLQTIEQETDVFFEPCRILLGVSDTLVVSERAISVLAFSVWVSREMHRINRLFESTHVEPTAEEVQAGIDKLSFGPFGLVDYFALRMGIADHEEVMNTPWVRVFQCMRIDSEKVKFERRLRKVYENKK